MTDPPPTAASSAAMGKGLAAIVTLGVVLLIVGFIVLGAAIGLVPLYAGFLLLWYFGSVDLLEPGALPALAIGAIGGTATAWALQIAVVAGSVPAIAAVLAAIVVAIWCPLVGWLPIAINRAFMLYLTVMAAPLLQAGERFASVLLVIALATLYFGGIVLIGRRVMRPRARP